MEKMSITTDKKLQKRYQRMLGNLITTTTDRYIYDCFCQFGGNFIRESDYNENKLRTALNASSEHTIKQSGQMKTSIQRTFPIGSELSVQEAKSMLKQVYKENGTEHRTRHHNKGAGTICRGGKRLETRQ